MSMIYMDAPRATLSRTTSLALLLTLFTLLTGCAAVGTHEVSQLAPAQRRYPTDAPRGSDLDIIVVRKGSIIELANRTPHSYRNMQLWLNEQWVGIVDIAIGTDNVFDLNDFFDRHGRSYPVGGLLSPDRSQPLVHAELYDPATDHRHRITVQLPRRQAVRGTGGILSTD